jgi:hypothetical protein
LFCFVLARSKATETIRTISMLQLKADQIKPPFWVLSSFYPPSGTIEDPNVISVKKRQRSR